MSLQDEFSALGQSKINIRNAIQSKGVTLASPNDMTTYAEAISGIVVGTRNIGQIIQSTIPLVDDGLHLLDGALIDGNGIYSAFVDYIADLHNSGSAQALFATESNWQSIVTTYGVCGKFVYDSVNNTVRLPKITGFVEGASGVTNLGDLTLAGLPNITGKFGIANGAGVINATGTEGSSYSGAFVPDTSITYGTTAAGASYSSYNMGIDASRSSSIYGNSTTVQPQSIKVLYYIVIATNTKTDIEVNIDEIATDLNGKADIDLTNVNNSGTSRGAGWAMPSDRYIDLTIGASGTTYTAPADGYILLRYNTTATFCYCHIANPLTVFGTTKFYNQSGLNGMLQNIEVRKGSTYKIDYSGLSFLQFRFIYAVGSESEA